MPDNSHHCWALWSLFDDISEVGQVLLRKFEQVVGDKMGYNGIPIHDEVTHHEVLVDFKGCGMIWRSCNPWLSRKNP